MKIICIYIHLNNTVKITHFTDIRKQNTVNKFSFRINYKKKSKLKPKHLQTRDELRKNNTIQYKIFNTTNMRFIKRKIMKDQRMPLKV